MRIPSAKLATKLAQLLRSGRTGDTIPSARAVGSRIGLTRRLSAEKTVRRKKAARDLGFGQDQNWTDRSDHGGRLRGFETERACAVQAGKRNKGAACSRPALVRKTTNDNKTTLARSRVGNATPQPGGTTQQRAGRRQFAV